MQKSRSDKIIVYIAIILMLSSIAFADGNTIHYLTPLGDITINVTTIKGTTIPCSNITGASYDVCVGDGGGAASVAENSIGDFELNYTDVTLTDFTNDAGFLKNGTNELVRLGSIIMNPSNVGNSMLVINYSEITSAYPAININNRNTLQSGLWYTGNETAHGGFKMKHVKPNGDDTSSSLISLLMQDHPKTKVSSSGNFIFMDGANFTGDYFQAQNVTGIQFQFTAQGRHMFKSNNYYLGDFRSADNSQILRISGADGNVYVSNTLQAGSLKIGSKTISSWDEINVSGSGGGIANGTNVYFDDLNATNVNVSGSLEVGDDIILFDDIIRSGDTNTQIQGSADQWNFLTGASGRFVINNAGVQVANGVLDLNSNEITEVSCLTLNGTRVCDFDRINLTGSGSGDVTTAQLDNATIIRNWNTTWVTDLITGADNTGGWINNSVYINTTKKVVIPNQLFLNGSPSYTIPALAFDTYPNTGFSRGTSGFEVSVISNGYAAGTWSPVSSGSNIGHKFSINGANNTAGGYQFLGKPKTGLWSDTRITGKPYHIGLVANGVRLIDAYSNSSIYVNNSIYTAQVYSENLLRVNITANKATHNIHLVGGYNITSSPSNNRQCYSNATCAMICESGSTVFAVCD